MDPINRIKGRLGIPTTPAAAPQWAKPRQDPMTGSVPPVEDEGLPWTDEDLLLAGAPCQTCGGLYGHDGVCPVGLEEIVKWRTRHDFVRAVRSVQPDYDPVNDFQTRADEAEAEEPGGPWRDYWRRAAAMAADIVEMEGPLPDPDPVPTGVVGQSAIQYLSRPHTHTPPRQTPAPRKKDDSGRLFEGGGPSNYDLGV